MDITEGIQNNAIRKALATVKAIELAVLEDVKREHGDSSPQARALLARDRIKFTTQVYCAQMQNDCYYK